MIKTVSLHKTLVAIQDNNSDDGCDSHYLLLFNDGTKLKLGVSEWTGTIEWVREE
jgi:hypothetical protein